MLIWRTSYFKKPITATSTYPTMLVSFFPEKSPRDQDDNKNDDSKARYLHNPNVSSFYELARASILISMSYFYNSSMLSLYNTLSRKTEIFKPLDDEKVKFYGCGPTVYNYAHIGNLCCYTFEDIIIRSLEFLGYEVDALMNLTDIDDKTIRDSQKEHTTLKAFTEHYTKLFFEDLTKLGITSFKRHKPISELVPEMIGMTQKLIDTKHAYVSNDGSVYFDIKSFKKYGNLAHLDTKGMKAGARVKQDEYEKESVSDFALWKSYDVADGENFWEAHFDTKEGPKTLKGRPGWHIECSACNLW